MNSDDLKRVLVATSQRGNTQWNTPSGAILDVLRNFIKENKIAEVADACRLYFSTYKGAAVFIASSLPALLVNNYKPIAAAVNFDEFLEWSECNPTCLSG
jgi:hypothetical protein